MAGHKKNWEFLKRKFEENQLSHAYLFSGQAGIGKKEFAKEFIKFINCASVEKPCNECVNCKLIQNESFPDLLMVKSTNSDSSLKNEKDMMEIDVMQIRNINSFLGYKSYYGGVKTVIIENAERMSAEAQNSFLKTLEEPKGSTLIILISSRSEGLLSTIFSRCQTITFFPFAKHQETKEEQKILQELAGVMGEELAIKFQYTKKVNLEGNNVNKILEVLERYFRNVMFERLGVIQGRQIHDYSIEKLKKIIKLIEALHQQIITTNASPKLALEILLMEI